MGQSSHENHSCNKLAEKEKKKNVNGSKGNGRFWPDKKKKRRTQCEWIERECECDNVWMPLSAQRALNNIWIICMKYLSLPHIFAWIKIVY